MAKVPTFEFFIFHFVFAVAVVAATASCAWFRPAEPVPPMQPAALVSLLETRAKEMRAMKGLFRAEVKGPGWFVGHRVDGAMFYQGPDQYRLRGFDRIGGELFDLIADQDEYRLRVPSAGRAYQGRLEEIDRLGELARPVQLSVMAMHAAVRVAPVSKEGRQRVAVEGGTYRLDVFPAGVPIDGEAGRPQRRIWFDQRSLQVVREEWLDASGKVDATLEYDDFRPSVPPAAVARLPVDVSGPTGAGLRPHKITTIDEQAGGRLTLTFREIVVNPVLKPEEVSLGARGPVGQGGGDGTTRAVCPPRCVPVGELCTCEEELRS